MKRHFRAVSAALLCTGLVLVGGCNGFNSESESRAGSNVASAEAEQMYRKGLDYQEGGNGSEISSEKAAQWFERAANSGHALAQMALAQLFRYTDSERYLYWMQRSAERGNAQAQLLLAHAYGRGEVLKPPKHATAFYWYNKAAFSGNEKASYWLGWSYLKGEGIPVNLDMAKYWFGRSSDPRAAEELAKLR